MIGPIQPVSNNVQSNNSVAATANVTATKEVINPQDAVLKTKHEKQVKDDSSKKDQKNKKNFTESQEDDGEDIPNNKSLNSSYNILVVQEQLDPKKTTTALAAHKSYNYFNSQESEE